VEPVVRIAVAVVELALLFVALLLVLTLLLILGVTIEVPRRKNSTNQFLPYTSVDKK
jgi:hypothetical protein